MRDLGHNMEPSPGEGIAITQLSGGVRVGWGGKDLFGTKQFPGLVLFLMCFDFRLLNKK